jgi:exodeoxyribonuclease VII large subunit
MDKVKTITVSQVNSYVSDMFKQDYVLSKIAVKGEVSNCKYHTSGHLYFTMKDEGGTLSAVMFAGNLKKLSFKISDGMQIVAYGRVGVYEREGKYQLYVDDIAKYGVGDLYQRYEELKKKFEEMGYFAPQYKRPIPKYSKKIGVVTAETGAAVQDIKNISHR